MIMGSKKLQKLFRRVNGLEIDKSDVKRTSDFIGKRLHTLLIQGEVTAGANGRDIINYQDIPITNGLQMAIHDFKEIDQELELAPILEHLATLPPLRKKLSDTLEMKLPLLVGAITVTLARIFRIVNEEVKNPTSREWEQVEKIYDILL